MGHTRSKETKTFLADFFTVISVIVSNDPVSDSGKLSGEFCTVPTNVPKRRGKPYPTLRMVGGFLVGFWRLDPLSRLAKANRRGGNRERKVHLFVYLFANTTRSN